MNAENLSQLSDLINQGKIPDSQSTQKTQELSQGEMQRIFDGEFTPLMSQTTEDLLLRNINNSPSMRAVIQEMVNKITPDSASDLSSSSSLFGQGRQEKKRTARIEDKLQRNPSDLNISNDLFDQPEVQSSLLNESLISNDTFSQIQVGSQPIEYLRHRTEQQQKAHLEQKKEDREKAEKDRMGEAMTQAPVAMVIEDPQDPEMMDVSEMEDQSIERIPSIKNEEKEETKKDQEMEKEEFMNITVIEEKANKTSDLAYHEFQNKRLLWTKMKCKVPIRVEWNVDKKHDNENLKIRVRFVHYENEKDIENAIYNPSSDVLKCLTHIKEETEQPPESFFYISPNQQWECVLKNPSKGSYFITNLAPGTNQIIFDLNFKCQKNCMIITDKRKSMCLAVFLEDKNGNEIIHTVIDEVQIVGYPKRDYRNFVAKSGGGETASSSSSRIRESSGGFHFPERTAYKALELERTFTPLLTRQPLMYKPCEKTFNTTMDFKMIPSTSNSRKRPASEHVFTSAASTPSRTPGYAMRLHGCILKQQEPMDYEHDVNENQQTPKRARQTMFPYRTLALSKDEYTKVVKFLAADAIETRNKWSSSIRYPEVAGNTTNFNPDDDIARFLQAVGLGQEVEKFHKINIFTMAHLTQYFEHDYNIFEKVLHEPAKLKRCHEAFLNYYRIQQAIMLNDE